MGKLIIAGLLLICLATASVHAVDSTEDLMLRTAYCACRCCEKEKECFRHDAIPATFKCSESNCNEKFCGAWDEAKCAKSCFCEKCKDTIQKEDYRCTSHRGVPESCDCKKHKTDCDKLRRGVEEVNEGLKLKMGDNLHCFMPCLCTKCKDSLPPEMYGECMMSQQPDEDCDCSGVRCPSQEVLDGLKKVREMRARNPDGSAYKFADEIDRNMPPEKAKEVKCKMQCYCDTCGASNENVYDTCQKMLPKPRLEGCECNDEDIKCPTQDLDQHCKLYCFCKGCKDDPRMVEKFLDSCEAMTKQKQDCLCADEEDCSVLDKFTSEEIQKKKEQMPKKGKLKKKMQDKDEL